MLAHALQTICCPTFRGYVLLRDTALHSYSSNRANCGSACAPGPEDCTSATADLALQEYDSDVARDACDHDVGDEERRHQTQVLNNVLR